MKKLTPAIAVSLTLLGSSAVLGQTTSPQPSASPPTMSPGGAPGDMKAHWYSHQAGEMRASQLIGVSVKNDANETIGAINEIVLGKDGKVAAVIIGVGGFLGMGEREVAIAFNALRLSHDTNNKPVIMFNVSKDALKASPAWSWRTDGTTKGPVAK